MQTVGKNIRILRMQKKMTQDELAEKLFVSRQTVSNYETGRSKPDIDTLLRIAEILGVDAQHLLYGSPDTNEQLAETRRLMIACSATAAAAILCHVVKLLSQLSRAHFHMGPTCVLVLLCRPVLFLLAGWAAMHAVTLLLKSKRPLSDRTRYTHRIILGTIIVYFLLVLPLCTWALYTNWQVWYLTKIGADYEYSSSFYVPVVSQLTTFFLRHHNISWAFFIPLGGALWFTGNKPQTNHTNEPSSGQSSKEAPL